MARGGQRTPRNPAPVSGPGAQSRRTDGGPAQAAKDYSGGTYGERKALADQQRAAPMAGGGASGSRDPNPTPSPGPPGQIAPAGPGQPGPPIGGVFGPTQRPGEAITAGVAGTTNPTPDADLAIRTMYRNFPHPALLQLIRRQTG